MRLLRVAVALVRRETGREKMKLMPLFLLTMFAFSGCATTPTHINDAKPIPADRIFAFQSPSESNQAVLTIIRDEGFIGGGCYLALYINQVFAARFDVAEFANFHVQPGDYLLRVERDPLGKGLCSYGFGITWKQQETTLKPGEQKQFRLSITQDGTFDIYRSEIKR